MPFEKFVQECRKIAGSHAGLLERPPKQLADLALPCFSLEGNPAETAVRLASEFSKKVDKNPLIFEIRAVGPYVNFYINSEKFSGLVVRQVMKEAALYGKSRKIREKIILEHTSINPSGPIHVGRLRNSIIGDSLKRILAFYGHPLETHYYVNDVGKQIAIIAWGEKHKVKQNPELKANFKKYKAKSDFVTMFKYVAAYAAVEKSAAHMEEVEKILQKCEKGSKKDLAVLKKTSQSCLSGQMAVMKKLGIKFDKFVFESKFIENGSVKKILRQLKKDHLLIEKDGALTLDLSKYGLRETVVLARKDGTSVYLLRDIAYHIEKLKHAECAINVLGEDHKIEFQELKTIIHNLFKIRKSLEALHYSFVNFQGMRLSTRLGQTAPLDMLLDEGTEKAIEEINKRGKQKANKLLAEKIAAAAIKYHIIKTDANKPITFVWEDALNFEGDTGPYLQYTYARAKSVLRKAGKKPKISQLSEEKEIALVKRISEFSSMVEKCAKELKPHHLAVYLAGLAAGFNEYYQSIRVIGSENEQAKLALVSALAITMKNGMQLLGIEPLEKM
jgi:arginyl-tRNA synthetase